MPVTARFAAVPGRLLLTAGASTCLGTVILAGAAWAGTQDYAYTCPPLDAATITVTGTAPAAVQPNAAFTVTDGVISGSVELGQFAGFVADGATADVTAAVVVGTDADPDGSVTVTVTLSKSGTVATFSQPLPPIDLVAGPAAATGVGISPGTATVTMGQAGATCTRTGAEGPFATFDVAGEPVAPPATTATTATTAPMVGGGSTGAPGGGPVLADSGADHRAVLLTAGGLVLVALVGRRTLRSATLGA